MAFPVAMLLLGAFFLTAGLVGHDTAGWNIGFQGQVGGIPRLLFVVASSVTLVLALVTFYVSPVRGPGTGVVPEPSSAVDRTVAPASSPVPADAEPRPSDATFTLLAELRPHLGEVSEAGYLDLDGLPLAMWTVTSAQPQARGVYTVDAGQHSFDFRGAYVATDLATGQAAQFAVGGSGTVQIADGGVYDVVYSQDTGLFFLRRRT